MDNSCADWYSSMIIKLTLNSDWTIWKNKLCESFANQGWNQVTYALLFKYKDGSLVNYAIKKKTFTGHKKINRYRYPGGFNCS